MTPIKAVDRVEIPTLQDNVIDLVVRDNLYHSHPLHGQAGGWAD